METNRIKNIDLLRAFAIVTVVTCHSAEVVYKFNNWKWSDISGLSDMAAFVALAFGRLGVPVFLMITGFLLLDREYDNKQIKWFWKHNWLRLFILTEGSFFLYDIFLKYYMHRPITGLTILKNLLFVERIDMSHVWYMTMILGYYILIPFVSIVLHKIDRKLLRFPFLFYGIFSLGYALIYVVNNTLGGEPISMELYMGFSGGYYGLYLILGFLLKKELLKKYRTIDLLLCFIVFFSANVLLLVWTYSHNYNYPLWYDFPFLMIASVCLFEMGTRIKNIQGYSIIRFVAKHSFSVYLLHNVIKYMIMESILNTSFNRPMKTILLAALCMGASLLISSILSKVPGIGKYLTGN